MDFPRHQQESLTPVLLEKLAEARPDVMAVLINTRDEVASSPFRDEIVGEMSQALQAAEGLAKQASVFYNTQTIPGVGNAPAQVVQSLKPGWSYGLGVAGAIGMGIATHLAGDMYDAVRRGLTKSRNYKRMISASPELHEMDPHKVRAAFDTLHRFNPEFSGDPLVASSFVRRNVLNEGGYADVKEIESLVAARKNLSDIKKIHAPSSLPMWDRESLQDKVLKHQQIARIGQEMGHAHVLHDSVKKKMKAEADLAEARAELENSSEFKMLQKRLARFETASARAKSIIDSTAASPEGLARTRNLQEAQTGAANRQGVDRPGEEKQRRMQTEAAYTQILANIDRLATGKLVENKYFDQSQPPTMYDPNLRLGVQGHNPTHIPDPVHGFRQDLVSLMDFARQHGFHKRP